jgi:CRP/FNR family cyclic AMP-dependent transcriptional regulator
MPRRSDLFRGQCKDRRRAKPLVERLQLREASILRPATLRGLSESAARAAAVFAPGDGSMPRIQIQFDKEALLAGHFLLRHLTRDELRQLAATATISYYSPRQTIFQKGDPGDSMMAVIRGRVKICTHSADGKELVLNLIDKGGVFGEIALLDGERRTADAVALGETDLLVLERQRLLPFLAANPEATLRLISVICKRLRQTSEHLEDVLFLEAPSRVARWLLRLAEMFGKPVPSGIRLDIKLSQQQIGSLVGVSRESVNKHLGDWQRMGCIGIDNGVITILDKSILEEIAVSAAEA